MPRRCALSPQRQREAVKAIVESNLTVRYIAARENVGSSTIQRVKERMYPALLRAQEKEALSVGQVALVCINEAIDVLETARTQENWAGVLAACAVLHRAGDLMFKAQESVGHQTTSAAVAGSDRDLLLAIAAEVEKRLK